MSRQQIHGQGHRLPRMQFHAPVRFENIRGQWRVSIAFEAPVSLNHLLVRAVELAASAGDDWQRRAAFLDLAIRAQSQSAAALIEARRLGGSGEQ